MANITKKTVRIIGNPDNWEDDLPAEHGKCNKSKKILFSGFRLKRDSSNK